MTFFRSLVLVCPAACLLAQTPPPAASPAVPATPVPKPSIQVAPARPPAPPVPVVPPDRVVLKLGDFSLTAAQFDQLIDMLPAQMKAQARGPGRKQFADNLVKVMTLAQEGHRRGLDQTPAFKLQTMFQQDNYLAGLTFSQLGNGKVTEEDAHKYYEEHKQEWDTITARHILIRFQGSAVPVRAGQKDLTDAEALAKAQDIRKRLLAGEDFATLAKAESDDTGSGANGGELGAFHHGQMVPAFEAAANSLKAGEISEPVKTQFGYHIIKVEKHDSKPFEEVRAEIEKRLGPEQSNKILEELVTKANPTYDPEFFNMAKQ